MTKRKDLDSQMRGSGKQPERLDSVLGRLGANIKRLRKQQGFSSESLSAQTRAQAALGQSCEVGGMVVVEIEAGRVDPTLTTVHAIAKALGVTIDALVY